nr:hypothetical protein [Paenibacillus brasilensis]
MLVHHFTRQRRRRPMRKRDAEMFRFLASGLDDVSDLFRREFGRLAGSGSIL